MRVRSATVEVEVVVNCGAGSVAGGEADEEERSIVAAFAAVGVTPRVVVATGDDLEDALRAAADRGPDVVAVAGGDGTMSAAAGILVGTGTAMGVLPRGTFNNLARDLDIPLDLDDAARVVVEGRTAAIDVAEVNGRTFVNNSSLGLYPVMVDLRDEIRSQRGWGKVRAVPVALARVLRRFPVRRLHITVGTERWDLRSPFVFVGNGRYEVGPGGVGDRSDLTEGVLCCYVARTTSRWRFVRMAVAAAVRGAASTPDLESECAPEVVVEAHGHRLLVAVDGEVETIRAPLRYRTRPGALQVRLPPDDGSEA